MRRWPVPPVFNSVQIQPLEMPRPTLRVLVVSLVERALLPVRLALIASRMRQIRWLAGAATLRREKALREERYESAEVEIVILRQLLRRHLRLEAQRDALLGRERRRRR
jgi:hypothetical protein